jgi:hypothetical protein
VVNDVQIEFFTWRCPDGYRVVNVPPSSGGSIATSNPGGSTLEALSDNVEPVPNPLADQPMLFRYFADLRNGDDGGIVGFANIFGQLTSGPKRRHQGRLALSCWREAINEMAARIEDQKTGRLDNIFVPGVHLDTGLSLRLVRDVGTGLYSQRLAPPSLHVGLICQWAQSVVAGQNLKDCEYCDRPFFAGGGAGIRADARFCSRECRFAFNYRKKTREAASPVKRQSARAVKERTKR